jgi:hypothetical protein
LHVAATALRTLAEENETPPAKRNRGNNHDAQPSGSDAASSSAPPVPMEPGDGSNRKHALCSTDEVGVEESEAAGNGASAAGAVLPCGENGEVFAAIRGVPQKVEGEEKGEVEQGGTQFGERVRQLLWLGICRVMIQLVRETLYCNRKTARAWAVDLISRQVNDITDDEKKLLAVARDVEQRWGCIHFERSGPVRAFRAIVELHRCLHANVSVQEQTRFQRVFASMAIWILSAEGVKRLGQLLLQQVEPDVFKTVIKSWDSSTTLWHQPCKRKRNTAKGHVTEVLYASLCEVYSEYKAGNSIPRVKNSNSGFRAHVAEKLTGCARSSTACFEGSQKMLNWVLGVPPRSQPTAAQVTSVRDELAKAYSDFETRVCHDQRWWLEECRSHFHEDVLLSEVLHFTCQCRKALKGVEADRLPEGWRTVVDVDSEHSPVASNMPM